MSRDWSTEDRVVYEQGEPVAFFVHAEDAEWVAQLATTEVTTSPAPSRLILPVVEPEFDYQDLLDGAALNWWKQQATREGVESQKLLSIIVQAVETIGRHGRLSPTETTP